MLSAALFRDSKVGMKEAETNTKDRGRLWELKGLKTRPGSRRRLAARETLTDDSRIHLPSLSARKIKVRRAVTTSNLSPCPRTSLIALAKIIPLEYIS